MVWIRQLWSQLGTSVKEMLIFFFFFSLAAFFSLSHLLIFSQFHRLLNTVNRCIRCSRILIRSTVTALKMQHLRPSGPLEVATSRFCMHKLLHVLKLTQRMLLLLKDLDCSWFFFPLLHFCDKIFWGKRFQKERVLLLHSSRFHHSCQGGRGGKNCRQLSNLQSQWI